MAKMVYDESYGDLTFALRAAIRKYNVSPSDYWDLQDQFGEASYAEMTAAIKKYSPNDNFSSFEMRKGETGSYWR